MAEGSRAGTYGRCPHCGIQVRFSASGACPSCGRAEGAPVTAADAARAAGNRADDARRAHQDKVGVPRTMSSSDWMSIGAGVFGLLVGCALTVVTYLQRDETERHVFFSPLLVIGGVLLIGRGLVGAPRGR